MPRPQKPVGLPKPAASPRKSKAKSKSVTGELVELDLASRGFKGKRTLAKSKASTAVSSTTPKPKATKKAGRRSNTETPSESGRGASKSGRRRRPRTKASG